MFHINEQVVEIGQATKLTLGVSGPDAEYNIGGSRPYNFGSGE